jgi:putative redox protein
MSTLHKVNTSWVEGLLFDSLINNEHHVILDAKPESGGSNKGPNPKPLLLTSLAGCTGMDVVALLNKMRVNFSDFTIDVSAELGDEHPKMYQKIHLIYNIRMDEADHDKMQKAVDLSQDKYCGVSAMLKKVCPVTWEIKYR